MDIWVGWCQLGTKDGDYTVMVSGKCVDERAFRNLVNAWSNAHGWRFLGLESPLPLADWATAHPFEDSAALTVLPDSDLPVASGPFQRVSDAQHWLDVTEITEVVPLDQQIGIWPKQYLPKALAGPLFEDAPDTKRRTYAIIDAAKAPLLLDRLQESELAYRCLFLGQAEKDLADVAPYLIELKPENDFTRRLFTKSVRASDLWDQQPGIFLRSSAPLDAVWKHLRKFTRVQNDAGEWMYFRFWDSPTSTSFLCLGNKPAAAALVSSIFAYDSALELILPAAFRGWYRLRALKPESLTRRVPSLTEDGRALLRRIRLVLDFDQISRIAIGEVAKQQSGDEAQAMRQLAGKRDRYYAMGFWRRDHMAKLCCWELMLGPDFLETDLRLHPPPPGAATHEVIRDIEARLREDAEGDERPVIQA